MRNTLNVNNLDLGEIKNEFPSSSSRLRNDAYYQNKSTKRIDVTET